MKENINYVSEGDLSGKKLDITLGKLFIQKGTFSSLYINEDTVSDLKILSRSLSKEKEIIYDISIEFKTKEKCVVKVNSEFYEKIISLFPSTNAERLKELLKDGWKIVGYSACLLGSGMTNGIVQASMGLMNRHYILLQKGLNVESISILTSANGKEMGIIETILSQD